MTNLGLPSTAGELVIRYFPSFCLHFLHRKHEIEKIEPEEFLEEIVEEEEKEDVVEQPMSIFDAIFGDVNIASSSSSEDENEPEKQDEQIDRFVS